MSSRRDFLCATSTAAAAWLALGAARSARAQNARKEIRVGGKRIKVVDIHAHCAFPEVNERVPGANAPRVAPPTLVLGPERFKSMDERGIDVQALSVNTYWWYSAEREAAKQIVAIHDEGLAKWCNANHERFVPLSSVALQFPDLAAEQLEHAVKNLGSRGASIGGHVNGEPPSAPKYDAFWAKAQELDVPVFMHPNNALNIARDGALDGRGSLPNIVGNPLETTVFLSHMIYDGTLDRFPRLKLCAAHGGGYLPSYLGRSDQSCTFRPDADCANKRKPSEYFKDQILVDTMVFSPEALRHLVAETGVSQVVYGSDMPYPWPDTIDIVVNAPFLRDADKEAILGGSLVKMLRIVA
ncbi:MAG TPA: amidohydrolase family protein [Gammaproteobacteria bacterium]|nr:amidohydrolase family protein [Gammaproteobacteria bacterium]